MKKNFLKIENDHNQNVNLMQSRLKRKCCWSDQLKKNDFGSRERERGGYLFQRFPHIRNIPAASQSHIS